MAENRAADWAKRFLDDVKERQINTIVTDGIVGRSMGDIRTGLVDIANTYDRKLKASKAASNFETPEQGSLDTAGAMLPSKAAFATLAKRADKALKAKHSAEDAIVYQRIAAMSTQLQGIAAKLESDEAQLQPEDRAVVAKVWELADGKIVMQTTIGLDGDLVTRIASDYLGDSHATTRELHKESVHISISTWESLVKGVLELAKAVVK